MASASPVVTPTPGTYPVPNSDAVGSTNASVGSLPSAPNGVQMAPQPTTAAGRVGYAPTPPLSPLSPVGGYTGPGHPFGAVSADKRPY